MKTETRHLNVDNMLEEENLRRKEKVIRYFRRDE